MPEDRHGPRPVPDTGDVPTPGTDDHAPDGWLADLSARLHRNVTRVLEGKDATARLAVVVLLAGGHLLVEDVPGVGKTLLAKALARSVDGRVSRLQFTPDLLPSDVTGVSVWNAGRGTFEFKPGAVFAHVVVGDEINRASPKTQAALLECMEEGQVSVDGTTYPLEQPFLVVATQNPADMEGTYPLPEAQRDRFTARTSLGYPSRAAEAVMLAGHAGADPLDELEPVADVVEVAKAVAAVREVHVGDAVRRYVVDVVAATREHPALRLGASPRAGLHLVRTGRALAAGDGREYVTPDDVRELAPAVLAHRLLVDPASSLRGTSAEEVVAEVLQRVPVPSGTGG